MKIEETLRYITDQLEKIYANQQTCSALAWHIIEAITKKPRLQLLINKYHLTYDEFEQIKLWLHRHIDEHMPLPYLIGTISFCSIDLFIEPPILIPRPETEQWVTDFIHMLKNTGIQKPKIVDLCTGSGCIALAIGHALPNATVIGVDNAASAIALAQKNQAHVQCTNVTFILSDLYQQLGNQQFDFIVANPPYISYTEWQSLDPSVTQWEDPAALWSENQGLACITEIVKDAHDFLTYHETMPLPRIFIEIGYNQGQACSALVTKLGYTKFYIKKDYAGNDRVLILYAKQIS